MHTCTLCLHGVPNIAVKIIITSEQEATWLGECHRRYTTDYVVVRIHGQLLVRTDVEKAACSIITPRRKCISIREELATQNAFLVTQTRKNTMAVCLYVCVCVWKRVVNTVHHHICQKPEWAVPTNRWRWQNLNGSQRHAEINSTESTFTTKVHILPHDNSNA